MFRTTTNPTFLKILPRLNLREDGMKSFHGPIEYSSHVSISIVLIVNHIVKRNLSDKHENVPIVVTPDKLNFYSMALVVQKQAIFLENFNYILGPGKAMGLPEKWSQFDDKKYSERKKKLGTIGR